MITIKADRKLFEKWNRLGTAVTHLRGVVQNDMEISDSEWEGWKLEMNDLLKGFDNLIDETISYIGNQQDEI